MKNILIILGYGELGGAERQAIHLAEGLSSKGYKVSVLNFGSKGRANQLLDEKGIRNKNIILSFAPGRTGLLKDLAKLYFTILRSRAAAIIPFTRDPNVYTNALKLLLPFTRIFWNQRDAGIGLSNTRLERFAIKRSRYIISNSIAGKDFLEKNYSIQPGRIAIIVNGVRLPEENSSTTVFNVGMIANLHAHKDFETLLKGWHLFKKNDVDPAAKLFIAGRNDGLLPQLTSLVTELGITDSVIFAGQQNNIDAFIKTLYAGVHSSRQEGCSNAILEMMSHGIPVVANKIPGNIGVLGDEYELYFPTGDAEKLADVLLDLYKSPGKANSIGKAN
ncbi:MAG TPA: glycosyltransferase family 4 protein, partial [Chitinophagaceae bacterium]|nr:glycosyltransferase family 4 protein [Chitinophagaceae bacterium]